MTYLALDGPDGCGKTSQAEALVGWLTARERPVLHVREPGSTPVGEALRKLLLSPATGELESTTEVLLFSAARCELVHRVVAPALARGEIVIAERCFLSTAVYQLLASTSAVPDLVWFDDLTRRVHGACLPDRILVLDVPADTSRRRRREREEDRIEARGAAYHERVRDAFLRVADREPRAQIIDASRSFDDVQQDLRAAVAGVIA